MTLQGLQPKDPSWLLGVDTSAAQGKLDIQALKLAGVSFAIFKATEGLHTVDGQWEHSAAVALDLGFPFGAYGVLDPNEDPHEQAAHFSTTVVRTCGLPKIPLFALDFELAHGMTGAAALDAAAAWVLDVEAALSCRVIVYTGPSFVETLEKYAAGKVPDALAVLGACPLWVAHYTTARGPIVPPPWDDWLLWQAQGDKGAFLPGTRIDVDVDWYRGTLAELVALDALLDDEVADTLPTGTGG